MKVWAAVWTAKMDEAMTHRPIHTYKNENYEVKQAASAAEDAWAYVTYLQEAGQEILEGWGEDSDVYQMWQEMTGGDR